MDSLGTPGNRGPTALLWLAAWAAFCFFLVRRYHPTMTAQKAPAIAVRHHSTNEHGFEFYLKRGQTPISPALAADAQMRRKAGSHEAPVAEGCRTLWTEIVALDLNRFSAPTSGLAQAGDLIALHLKDTPAIRRTVGEIFRRHDCRAIPASATLASLRQYTALARRECQSARTVAPCLNDLVWLRLYGTRFLTRDVPLDQISDLGALVNLLFVDGLTAQVAQAPELALLAERIIDRDPASVDAAHAAVQFRYLDFVANGQTAEARDALDRALQTARKIERRLGETSAFLDGILSLGDAGAFGVRLVATDFAEGASAPSLESPITRRLHLRAVLAARLIPH